MTEETSWELLERRRDFVQEEADLALGKMEVWVKDPSAGTEKSKIVSGGSDAARSYADRVLEGGAINEMSDSFWHKDEHTGDILAFGFRDPNGVECYFYPAPRASSWWEEVDRRMDEAGFPPDYLTEEMRGSIHREIASHLTFA